MAAIWSLWRERNAGCFDGKSFNLHALVERAKFLVASWVAVLWILLSSNGKRLLLKRGCRVPPPSCFLGFGRVLHSSA